MATVTTKSVTVHAHTLVLSDVELKILTSAMGSITRSRIVEKFRDLRDVDGLEKTMMDLWDTLNLHRWP